MGSGALEVQCAAASAEIDVASEHFGPGFAVAFQMTGYVAASPGEYDGFVVGFAGVGPAACRVTGCVAESPWGYDESAACPVTGHVVASPGGYDEFAADSAGVGSAAAFQVTGYVVFAVDSAGPGSAVASPATGYDAFAVNSVGPGSAVAYPVTGHDAFAVGFAAAGQVTGHVAASLGECNVSAVGSAGLGCAAAPPVIGHAGPGASAAAAQEIEWVACPATEQAPAPASVAERSAAAFPETECAVAFVATDFDAAVLSVQAGLHALSGIQLKCRPVPYSEAGSSAVSLEVVLFSTALVVWAALSSSVDYPLPLTCADAHGVVSGEQ